MVWLTAVSPSCLPPCPPSLSLSQSALRSAPPKPSLLGPRLPVLSPPPDIGQIHLEHCSVPGLLGDAGPRRETDTKHSRASGSEGPMQEMKQGHGTDRQRPFWGGDVKLRSPCPDGARHESRNVPERVPEAAMSMGLSREREKLKGTPRLLAEQPV